jgi:hypothetical protein
LKTNKLIIESGIFGSLLPPLGLFSQNKFFCLSLSQKHSFWQIKRSFKSEFEEMPKIPPFPIIKFLPHKRTIFAIEGFDQTQRRVLIKHKKSNYTIFEIHKWLADPVALALISPPLELSTKTGERFGPLTPLRHQNVK